MKKKIFSLILAVVLVASMMTVAMVSVSASIDENGRYVPSTEDTYRYYFYMPNSWKNSYTQDTIAGVYWWAGTDKCNEFGTDDDGAAWPGYVAQHEADYKYGSVYYIDCPDDVATIIWNNYVNGGTFDKETGEYQFSKEQYTSALQTADVNGLDDAELYANEELYPDGLEDFGDMIYVLDYSKTQENALNGKITCVGEWYYYYGAGKYGIQPTLEEAEAADAVFDSEYYPAINHDATPDVPKPVAPAEPGDKDKNDQDKNDQDKNDQDTPKPTAGDPSNDASSSTKDSANKNDNGTVQTGDASMAFIVLFSVVAAAGVAIFARKKIFG